MKRAQSAGRFVTGGASEVVVLVTFDHGKELFTALKGLFGLDLGPESGVGGGARIALEHLDAVVPILDRARDRPAWAARDEPGECAAELAGAQRPSGSP